MIRVLDRAIAILNAVAGGGGLTLSEISKDVDLPCNTTQRILLSLISHGFVRMDERGKTYLLGPRLLSLSTKVAYPPQMVEVATSSLQNLSARTQEDVGIATLVGNNAVIRQTILGPNPLKIIGTIQNIVPLYCGAFRKLLLAHQPKAWINHYLDTVEFIRFTNTTIMDRKVLEEELEDIRKRGYSIGRGEFCSDAVGVAAPVFGLYEELLAAVFIVVPVVRTDEQRLAHLATETQTTAKEIMRHIRGEEC